MEWLKAEPNWAEEVRSSLRNSDDAARPKMKPFERLFPNRFGRGDYEFG